MDKAKSSNDPQEWRTAACVTIAFVNFLRISEVVSLRMNDLSFTASSITITVRQAKRRADGFQAVMARDTSYCQFIEEFWARFKLSTKSKFYCFPLFSGTKLKGLSSSALQKDLKHLLHDLGYDCAGYAFHSCKIGGTTVAAEKGMNTGDIISMGRWKSRGMIDRYSRVSNSHLEKLSLQLCNSPAPK